MNAIKIRTRIKSRRKSKIGNGLSAAVGCMILLTGCAGGPKPSSGWSFDHEGVVRGDLSRKRLALVFTGGSFGEGGPAILDALQAEHVKASFFVTGEFLERPERRALVERMVAEGHYVGPHSHGHLLYCPWEDREKSLVTEEEFAADLERNLADLRALGALRPGERVFFIPPFEWYNVDQVRWAASMGITLFNFTPGIGSNRDWIPEDHPRFVPAQQILEGILAFESREPAGLNGAIVLLHLGSARTDKMHRHLPALLAALRARGYHGVRIDELLDPGHVRRRGDGRSPDAVTRKTGKSRESGPPIGYAGGHGRTSHPRGKGDVRAANSTGE